MRTKLLSSLFFLFSITAIKQVKAQMVYENINSGVYEYLDRMSQKGFIQYHDLIKPISKSLLYTKLLDLKLIEDKLLLIEQKELDFYLKKYIASNEKEGDTVKYLNFKRGLLPTRFFEAKSGNAYINASPVIQFSTNTYSGSSYNQKAWGEDIWGRIGKHIGFNFSSRDVSENRTDLTKDSVINNAQMGYVLLTQELVKTKIINYSEYRASIGYEWKNGFVSYGQDNLLWGYGVNGKMVLSEKSPYNQYLRLNYQPFTWFKFDYFHVWLNSNNIDSNSTYGFDNTVYGGQRVNYVAKYLTSHTATFTPHKGVNISFGESIVYTEKLDLGFLFPIMFYKIYDNNKSNYNILNGNNSQFFLQISFKNIIPNAHLYSTLLIDEIKISKIFDENQSRNQFGFNLGLQVNDLGIRYLSWYGEYTRVNPFVYTNLNPVQNYTSYGYNLGDWVGNNFDRKILGIKYTPLPRLKLELRYQDIKKGPTYSAEQQYLQTPSKKFLETVVYAQTQYLFSFNYEFGNNMYFVGNCNKTTTRNEFYNAIYINNNFSLGVKIGL